MFRLSNARMPRIKTMAVAARQSAPSIGPELRPFTRNTKPTLKLIQGGKSEGAKEFGKRKLCTFCANELNAQDEDMLMEWRRQAAIFIEHLPNPDKKWKRHVDEDLRRDSGTCLCFGYSGDKSFK